MQRGKCDTEYMDSDMWDPLFLAPLFFQALFANLAVTLGLGHHCRKFAE